MNEYSKTISASWYFDSNIYEIERKTIFGSEWLYIAEESDFKNIGDYAKFDIAGYPLFLVKDNDQIIRGFHNVCIHRASPIVTEKNGNLKNSSVTCKYHGWTYNLKGELTNTPFIEISEVKKQCNSSLFELKVENFNGLLFVNLDKNSMPFNEFIEPLNYELKQSGYLMQKYTSYESMQKEGKFNWKTWIDGFQECYHCMTIHPLFNKDFYLKKYKVENKDRYSVHSCERKNASAMGEFQGLWLWNYPNLGLPCYENCFYTLQVNPINNNNTQLNYRFRFKPEVSEICKKEFISMVEKITLEDITICEQVQKNLEAGIYQEGILHPERENGVVYFHNLLKRAISNYKGTIHVKNSL